MNEAGENILQTRLRALMSERQIKPATLALKAGLSDSYVRDILRGKASNPKAEYLARVAAVLEVSVDYLVGATNTSGTTISTVNIVGKAGAGPDGTVLFARGDGNLGLAEAPLYATPETKALEVEGESMRGIADDGSLIFFDEREAPDESHIGELCICWLDDDRVMIKYPYQGTAGSGLWNLESTTAATLRDVSLRWLAHVTSIVPRRTARLLIRSRVDLEIEDAQITK